jgi:hypothetical protein
MRTNLPIVSLALAVEVREDRNRHGLLRQPLLLETALEVADRVHLAKVYSDINKGLGDLGGQARDDHDRAEEPRIRLSWITRTTLEVIC